MKKQRQPIYKTEEQVQRALAQRAANRAAGRRGEPLPYPNFWDKHDPTKLPPGASQEEIEERYREFVKICPPPQPIEYWL